MSEGTSERVVRVDDLVAQLRAEIVASDARNEALASTNSSLSSTNVALTSENQSLATENAELLTEKEQAQEQTELLRRQLSAMLKKVFHKTSERMDPKQLWMQFESLLDDAQRALLEESARGEAKKSAPRKRREEKPRGAGALPEVRRERETAEPPEEDRRCDACSGELRRIGEDVSSQLEWVPGHFVLREVARGKWACGCGLGSVVTELAPKSVIPKSIATPSLLGHLAVSRFADYLPLFRQARIFERAGVKLPTSTLSDWMHQVAVFLAPLRAALARKIARSSIVALDDTRLEMQRNSKKLKRKRCYLWAYRSSSGETVFDFSISRAGTEPLRFLKDMKGHVQGDGYVAHNVLFGPGSGRIRVGCLAHARRKYVDAMDSEPERASLAVALIGRLYDVEREAKERELSAEARCALRRERCPRIFSMLRDLLKVWELEVLPKSGLGEAIGYTLRQWETLLVYVEDGRLEIDNMAIERSIRGVALGRRNSLFVGSERGGHDTALYYSLIESCRSAGVEPMEYLTDVIGRIQDVPESEVDELMPARWKAARDAQRAAAAAAAAATD